MLAAFAALCALPAPAAAAETRFSIANGCFTLTDAAEGDLIAGAERLRLKATRLGSYLLYRPDRSFLAAGSGGPAPAAEPSPAAEWRARRRAGGSFNLTPASGGSPLDVRLVPAEGCATFPEAELNASGRPRPSETDYRRVGGFVEGHMHWMTYQYFGRRFHCGKPWDRYGITEALPDCAEVEGPQGLGAPVQNFLNFGNPAAAHDTRGYPFLTETRSDNLTYEGTYYRWVERAYLSGLRLMVMGVNENRVLCTLQAARETNCNEMDTVRRGFAALRELQNYVDAQAGGPGEGFFEIVTNPFEARRVINEGRMAVVLEIEISELFDCTGAEAAKCTRASVDRQLDEMYRLGVRSSLLLNKFDNPLTGVRFDSGPIGAVINAGNQLSFGSFWDAETCSDPTLSDNTIETGVPDGSALLESVLGQLGTSPGALPAYPKAPHCNTRGLTGLGRHVVRRMVDLGMIVNPDHMSQAAVDDTLDLLENRSYSGVISPHGWVDPDNWPRIWKLGGVAWPGHSAANDYVDEWKRYRPRRTPFEFGWGYGADLGGLSRQPTIEGGTKVEYPFRSYDGSVRFERQRTGQRTFDYTREGVSHYGLYPEWFEDLRLIGGQKLADDMWNGSEAYLQMWERAVGVKTDGCAPRRARVRNDRLGPLGLGTGWRALLKRAGQPRQRSRSWSWCVRGDDGGADVAVLSRAGRVVAIGSNADGRSAGPVAVGDRADRLPDRFRPVGDGVMRGGREIVVVEGGGVVAVGLVSRSVGKPGELRDAGLRIAGGRASNAPPSYRASDAQRERREQIAGEAPVVSAPLSGTENPQLDAAFELLCRLQA